MDKYYTIDDIWKLFMKYFIKILNMAIIGASLTAIIVMFFVEAQYSSQAQLIVNQRSEQENSIQNNDIQTNVRLVRTYSDIILGDGVLMEVSESLGEKFTTPELRQALDIEQSTDSQAFNISATMDTPADAQNVVNGVISQFEETLVSIYGDEVSNVYVVSPASFNPSPVSPNIIFLTLMGGILGAMFMIVIALIVELMDTHVKSSEDLAMLNVVKLGEVYELSDEQRQESRLQTQATNYNSRRRV